ncbi:MAG: hypothetical protein QOI57_2690 [Rubrobacteraceae bacterium]|jgi:hypothetical protein|nr:hypothetical protein [Rubrobacteraceae bacterium]
MTVVKRTEGCYEVQDVEFGKVYRWEPGSVMVECDCGERTTLTRLESVCMRCGTDHTHTVLKILAVQQLEDETLHPWRYAGDREGAGLPC